MFPGEAPCPNASTEPLGAIESATCCAYPEDLVTRRFHRLFNEIARLQLLLAEELDMAT
jgi:hypothetical protein